MRDREDLPPKFERVITWTGADFFDTGEIRLGSAEQPLKGQDQIVSMPEHGVYAVFDGMGGVGGHNAGAIASSIAAEICTYTYKSEQGFGKSVEHERMRIRTWLEQADSNIAHKGEMGTTATVIRMVEEGEKQYVVFASVGDSRLYLYRNKQLSQLTEDEGRGHVLRNWLGRGDASVKQTSYLRIQEGDRLMLCTDGITGDYDDDVLYESEIMMALDNTSPQGAADRLLSISRKQDDKSVIVLDVVGNSLEGGATQEHLLSDNEVVALDLDKPLEDRGSFNVVASVKAANNEFLILDLRKAPETHRGRIPFGTSLGYWQSDFLIVDETFFAKWGRPAKNQSGYKGLRADEHINVGRNDEYQRFSLPGTVSRKHFGVEYDGEELRVLNYTPRNKTTLTTRR